MRETKPGTWELRVSLGRDPVTGRLRQRSRTFHGGKRAATTELNRLVAATADHRSPDSSSSVAYALDEWYRYTTADLSPTTAYEYRRLIDRLIVPELGKIPLGELTGRRIDQFYRRLSSPVDDGGRNLSPMSVQHVHSLLRRALNQAVKWEWIDQNPCRRATPPRLLHSEVAPPELAVLWQIVDEAQRQDPQLATLFLVAAGIGARRSELIALRWGDVDFERAVVHIRRGVVKVNGSPMVEKLPKTHAVRSVELDALTLELLARHRESMVERARLFEVLYDPAAFVFSPVPSGREPLRPERATRAFARIRDKVGARSSIRLHDLRHLNASMLIAEGVPITEVSKRLGHSLTSTTQNIYGHRVPGKRGDGPGAIERAMRRPD